MRRIALIMTASVVLLGAIADAASARTVWFEGAVGGYGHVKPSNVALSADGTLWVSHVKWSAWGGRVAVGRGLGEGHGCTRSCAQARVHTAQVKVELYDVVQCGSHEYYDNARLYRLNGRVFARPRFNWAPCKAAEGDAISSTAVALAARTLPAFPTFPYTTEGLRVRPGRILTTPTAGGPELVGNVHFGPIKWRSWTARSAVGAGVVITDSGRPDLVSGYKPAATVTFELNDPEILGGRFVFRKLRLKHVKRIRGGNSLYGFHGLTVKLGSEGYYFAE